MVIMQQKPTEKGAANPFIAPDGTLQLSHSSQDPLLLHSFPLAPTAPSFLLFASKP